MEAPVTSLTGYGKPKAKPASHVAIAKPA